MASKNRMTVNLDDQEYQELHAMSQEHQVSMAWLGRQAILKLLDQYKQNEIQLPLRFADKEKGAS